MSDVYVPRHERRDVGDWPHTGCDKAQIIDDEQGPDGSYALRVHRRTGNVGPEGAPKHVTIDMNCLRHDGILQPDGTRAFPINYTMNTFHEHPGGRCPSLPAAATAASTPTPALDLASVAGPNVIPVDFTSRRHVA